MSEIKATASKRLNVRMTEEEYAKLAYWSDLKGVSMSEYMVDALALKIKHENADYDLPTAEQQRLNQLIENMDVLSRNVAALETITVNGFDSLLGLVKGDNYLLDSEDGEY